MFQIEENKSGKISYLFAKNILNSFLLPYSIILSDKEWQSILSMAYYGD